MPPRSAATVVLLREGSAAMELLTVRRSSNAANFGGAFVFPGGVVDDGDLQPRALLRVIGMSETEANRRLAVESGGLGHWVAVVRECYEEAGILLALDECEQPLGAERLVRLEPQRAALNAGELSFTEFLERERLLVPANAIAYFAHWITPPTQERRFDTRFFLALAPAGQQVLPDNSEIVASLWLPAGAVLERVGRDEMKLALVTQHIVSSLGKFGSTAEALGHARSLAEVEVNRPCVAQGREGRKIFRLGDAPYAEIHWVDADETGTSTYDLQPGIPKKLDRYVSRLLAPNPGVMTGPGTNTYLVGESELAVIDPGPADSGHIEAILAAGAGRIRWIVVTHTHRDHSAAVGALREATGAVVAGRRAPSGTTGDTGFAIDRVLGDGESLQFDGLALSAIHTPGHASNHLCYLLDKTRMLFTGDHIMQGSTVVIRPPDGNLRAYLSSLERLVSFDIAILAPGHGYLIGQPRAELARLIRHRLAREDKVRKALAEEGGSATLPMLLPRVYADVPAAIHPVAAHSLLAHLEKLVEEGEVACAAGRYSSQKR